MSKANRINRAKQYLNQIKDCNALIEAKTAECNALYDMVTRITPVMKSDMVSGGGGQHDKIADAVAKIVDLKKEINAEIDRYVDLKLTVSEKLEQMDDKKHYKVLHKRYVLGETFERIATEMDYTYRGVCYLHGRALQEFEKILNSNKF